MFQATGGYRLRFSSIPFLIEVRRAQKVVSKNQGEIYSHRSPSGTGFKVIGIIVKLE
jgi:hypothetical protein